MARTSVKNMSRNQQKAVFANLGNKPSTVSNMSARRESLMHNSLVTENQQDKIDKIMRDSRLTHRQKMDRIAKVKTGSHSSGSSDTGVPVSSKTSHVDAPAVKLIYQKALVKAEKRRLQRKSYRERHPGAVFEPTEKPGVYLLKEHGETFTWKDGKKVPPTMKQNIADAKKMGKEAHERRKKSKGSSLKGRSNLYKDAYATKGEAEGIKDHLEHEGHTDVFIFTDKTGDWNIAYNKKLEKSWKERYAEAKTADQVKKHKKEWKSDKTLYLVKFVNKDTKQRDFREISARSKKDARKILLSQQKNVGIVSIHEKTAQAGLLEKKLLARKQYRVGVVLPGVGGEKDTVVKSNLMTKKKAESLALKKRKLGWDTARAYEVKKKDQSYKELKASGIKLKPGLDYDGDGVKNSKDCRPMNKNKQDLFDKAVSFGYSAGKASARVGTKFVQKKLHDRTAEGRAEIAQKKIDKIEAKEKKRSAERNAVHMERLAIEREKEYKRDYSK